MTPPVKKKHCEQNTTKPDKQSYNTMSHMLTKPVYFRYEHKPLGFSECTRSPENAETLNSSYDADLSYAIINYTVLHCIPL